MLYCSFHVLTILDLPLNPLSLSIYIQILQTDLYTFPMS